MQKKPTDIWEEEILLAMVFALASPSLKAEWFTCDEIARTSSASIGF